MAGMLEQVPLARATAFHEYHYEIDANWKLTYDNFQENYHLRFVHPRTAGQGGLWDENPFGYPSHFTLNGIHRTQTIWTNPEPDMQGALTMMFMRGMPRLMADGLMQGPYNSEYLALFPNVFLLCNPGQHFLHTVLPARPGKDPRHHPALLGRRRRDRQHAFFPRNVDGDRARRPFRGRRHHPRWPEGDFQRRD